jgi:hypothetical protein
MPAKRAPRLLLLDQVAQAFEPGRRYDEATVSGVLKTVTDDHAALRCAGTWWTRDCLPGPVTEHTGGPADRPL